MLASGRKSEGNEGAEKRIPSVPLGMKRGREDRGKHVDNNGHNVDNLGKLSLEYQSKILPISHTTFIFFSLLVA